MRSPLSYLSRFIPSVKAQALTPAPPTSTPVHDAASRSTRTRDWNPPQVTNVSLTWDARIIRHRSRDAWRNDAFARGGIERLVTAIVGTGIKPLSKSPDAAFRKQVHELWNAWTDVAGSGVTRDFYGMLTAGVREWLVSGESWLRIRPRRPEDGLPVPLQIELLPAEAVAEDYSLMLDGDRNIVQGVQIGALGEVQGYWARPFYPLTGMYNGVPYFIPEQTILHLFREEFPKQLRGIPHIAGALLRLREIDLFMDATLKRAQLANLFTAFWTGSDGILGDDEDGTLGLAPGRFQRLGPGEDVKWSEPPSLEGTSFETFVRSQLTAVGAALHMSYGELTGDTRDLTDRVIRVQRLDLLRHVAMLQHQVIAPVLQRIYEAFLEAAIRGGALPAVKALTDAHRKVEWIPQRHEHFHPVQDAQAIERELRLGLTSRSSLVAEDGRDPEDLDAEIKADNDRADTLKLKFDGDGRQQAAAGAAAGGKGASPDGGEV